MDNTPEEIPWEEAAPGFALAHTNIDLSLQVLDRELCSRYRKANPDAKGVEFLYEAYEPQKYYFESLECLRRLALTGMLIFFEGYGANFQIAVGGVVALGCYTLYSQEAPFMDDEADAVATVAQMSTFTQLFAALLIETDVLLEAKIPEDVITTLMLITNVLVMVMSMAKPIYETFGPYIKEYWDQFGEAIMATKEFFFPEPEEGEEAEFEDKTEAAHGKKRTPEQMLKYVIFKQRGRKITDIISIDTGAPKAEHAADAASKWLTKVGGKGGGAFKMGGKALG